MSTILEQPLGAIVKRPGMGTKPMTDAGEILLARVATLVYDLVQRAPKAELTQVASSGSSADFVNGLAELLRYETPSTDERLTALLAGRLALAKVLEASGGVLLADEAAKRLGVTRSALQNWRDTNRVLALRAADGSYIYPVGQFEQPKTDAQHPRPFEAIKDIRDLVDDALTVDELIGLLASPQPMLAHRGRDRSGFEALADGDAQSVLDMIRHTITPDDADAPPVVAEISTTRAK